MRSSRWQPKATNTHTGFVILISFPLQPWLNERAFMLRYTFIACLVGLVDEDTQMLRNIIIMYHPTLLDFP